MSLLHWLRRPLLVRQVAIWGIEIARRCHPQVSVRLGQNMYRISIPEARGYIRARCAAVLDDEIGLLAQQTGCDPAMALAVRRRAVIEITRLAIGDLLKATRYAAPLRRAAISPWRAAFRTARQFGMRRGMIAQARIRRPLRITVMSTILLLALTVLGAGADPLTPGDYTRSVQADGRDRSYLVHVPPQYDPKKSIPVVLALHGAWTNGRVMEMYSGLNRTADSKGFVVVYPNGTGPSDATLFWNSGRWPARTGREPPNDVAFMRRLLDDLGTVIDIDPKRIYATGISNGGMMCHRLAAEMSDCIAAIAPVSGTLCFSDPKPQRPVPVLEFHGTADKIVSYDGKPTPTAEFLGYKSVDETVGIWAKFDGCPDKPKTETLPDKAHDGTTLQIKTYGPGKDASEVVLVEITGGGHTWPGATSIGPTERLLGKTNHAISANEMIWEFFQRHPLK